MKIRAYCLGLLASVSPIAALAATVSAGPDDATTEPTPEVLVIGQRGNGGYTVKDSESATKFALSPKDTPQSISVITREQMDDFALKDINAVLRDTPGVTVESVEANRTYFTARGFNITNFQYDGFGLPIVEGIQVGDIDTATYERIEVLRGANGLLSSTGNPSATVNFVRKRPTQDLEAAASFTTGSFDKKRGDADVSVPLNASGSIRARVVGAYENSGSYLDRLGDMRGIAYGVLEADLDDRTTVTVGHSYQNMQTSGGMWGALPLYYTDGTPTHYSRSTNTSADWSHWQVLDNQTFADISRDLGDGWKAKASVMHRLTEGDDRLFYVYGQPDRQTGDGLAAYPSLYRDHNRQWVVEGYASGPFTLFGRSHELVLGGNWGRNNDYQLSNYGQGIGTPLPGASAFEGRYPYPSFDASVDYARYRTERETGYGAVRLSLADPLKLIAGVNVTHYESQGVNYSTPYATASDNVLPYAGLVYEVTPEISAYTSYAQIFNPQVQLDASNHPLAPITGDSVEVGVKGAWFGGRLNASADLFQARQNNTAQDMGVNPLIPTQHYYQGINATSQGMELEVSGQVSEQVQVTGGYTLMRIQGDDGRDVNTYVPRHSLRLSTTYSPIDKLKLGASVSWQSRVYRDQGAVSTTTGAEIFSRQGSYALLGLMARYDLDKNWYVSANLNNLTNEKYLTSLYTSQGYYGAPFNGIVTIGWKM